MKCQDIQSDLPLFGDDLLTNEESAKVELHLTSCPLCRARLSEFKDLKNGLLKFSRPEISVSLQESIKTQVRLQLSASVSSAFEKPMFARERWIDRWLMPYAVGTVSATLLFLSLMWAVFATGTVKMELAANTARPQNDNSNKMDRLLQSTDYPAGIDLSPLDYAHSRASVAYESPSINPHGALAALTRSVVRGEMKDEEVVIVAEVFGNGLARIAEIVERPKDDKVLIDLQKALQSDPDFAPFVPAKMDNRSDNIHVIIKLHNVNVKASAQ